MELSQSWRLLWKVMNFVEYLVGYSIFIKWNGENECLKSKTHNGKKLISKNEYATMIRINTSCILLWSRFLLTFFIDSIFILSDSDIFAWICFRTIFRTSNGWMHVCVCAVRIIECWLNWLDKFIMIFVCLSRPP